MAFLNLCKTFPRRALEFCAAKNKVAHGVFVRLLLFCVQVFRSHGFVLGVQALVGAQAGPKFSDQGQGAVVSGTQLGGVCHAIEMAYRAPSDAELFSGNVEFLGNGTPLRRKVVSGDGV